MRPGNMIIDIGGGTTEVALISLSGIVFCRSVRVAGDELDEAIIQYMKRAYNLMIGERTAEDIKIKIGSAYPIEKETTMEVKGRDLVAGLPKTLTITSQEVREALLEPISTIVDSVRVTLERCPPELSADLVDRGLVLAGGGALLRGLDRLLTEETGLPVHVAEDPLSAVAEGTGRALSEIKFLRQVATSDSRWSLNSAGMTALHHIACVPARSSRPAVAPPPLRSLRMSRRIVISIRRSFSSSLTDVPPRSSARTICAGCRRGFLGHHLAVSERLVFRGEKISRFPRRAEIAGAARGGKQAAARWPTRN